MRVCISIKSIGEIDHSKIFANIHETTFYFNDV
jgi:hypothetical protein